MIYLGDDDRLPQDARGITWFYPSKYRTLLRSVTLEREIGGGFLAHVPVSIEHAGPLALIVPRGGFVADSRYHLRIELYDDSMLDYRGELRPFATWQRYERVIRIDPVALTRAGEPVTLTLGAPTRRRVRVNSRPCSVEHEATVVPVKVSLSPALEPYRGSLLFSTFVAEGDSSAEATAELAWRPSEHLCQKPPPGRTWLSPDAPAGDDLLYVNCEPRPAPRAKRTFAQRAPRLLAEGRHRVRVEVSTLDGRFSVSSAWEEFELRCAPADPGAGLSDRAATTRDANARARAGARGES